MMVLITCINCDHLDDDGSCELHDYKPVFSCPDFSYKGLELEKNPDNKPP